MMYVQRFFPSSLHHTGLLLILGALILGLTGCYTQLQTADEQAHQKTPKKQADLKKSYADAPLASLRTAELDTDQQRIQLATKLLMARANTEISHSTYKEGVHFFRKNYPQFYGNFFGDPFYASYDTRYLQLVHARQRAELTINPQNSYWDETSFYCAPLSYDPAFGGICSGITYAASEFFFLPPPFSFQKSSTSAAPLPPLASTHSRSPKVSNDASSTPDTTRQPDDVDERISDSRDEQTEKSESSIIAPRVPETAYSSMQETVASLKRTETILRIQREIARRSERRQLSFRERARVARRIAEKNGIDDLAQAISQEQSIRGQRRDTPVRTRTSRRSARDEISRRSQQERTTRSANPGSSESARDRSRSSERASSGSESSGERSRSRSNSSDS